MIDEVIKFCKKHKCAVSVDYNRQTGQAAIVVSKIGLHDKQVREKSLFEKNNVEQIDGQARALFDARLENLIRIVDLRLEGVDDKQLEFNSDEKEIIPFDPFNSQEYVEGFDGDLREQEQEQEELWRDHIPRGY